MINRIKYHLKKIIKRIGQIWYKDENLYLIYSMGKVGSSSIYRSLKKKIPFADIFHVHHLSDHWLHEIIPKGHKKFFPNITLGEEVLRFVKDNPDKRKKVITLTREPVMRSISDLFQNWEPLFQDINKVDNQALKNHVESLDYEYALNWFDSEFKRYLEVDMLELPFDKEKGYQIYNFKDVDICCIKLEKLNDIHKEALTNFLGMELNLFTANKSSEKEGKEKYKYLKDNVQIDKEVLDRLYNSEYMQHFYTESEIADFRSQWTKKD